MSTATSLHSSSEQSLRADDAMQEGSPKGAARKGSGREVEIKFLASPDTLDALLRSPLLKGARPSPARELVSTYYDTPDQALRRNGIALRLRQKGKARPVIGVKWSGGEGSHLFSRGEIEVPSPRGHLDLTMFDEATRKRLSSIVKGEDLARVFEARVRRRRVVVKQGASDIEIALDDGVLLAGGAEVPVCEAELELTSGSMDDLLDLAAALAGSLPLRLAFDSKSARGYRLLNHEVAAAVKAGSLDLERDIGFDDLVSCVLSAALSHFAANWAALREADAPEAVHQLRVSLRRMRSAIGMFRKAAGTPELEEIGTEARRLATALGPARACDVFRHDVHMMPATELKGLPELLAAVEARRVTAYGEARRVIDEAAASLFVLKLQRALHRRPWQGATAQTGREFASQTLGRLRRRGLKRGRDLGSLSDDARHELRIGLKKLRYGVEFFGSLFGNGKERRHFLLAVAALQDILGAHNDAVAAQDFLDGLAIEAGSDAQFAAGFVLGWQRHAASTADARLMKAWKEFRRCDPFWT